jgi:hypothetical protein
MNRPRTEQVVAILVASLAAGMLVWGVLAEQLGDTLFNATLV